MSVVLRNNQGKSLGSINLQPPNLLPKTAYYVDGAPEGAIDLTPLRGSVGTIQGQGNLEKLEDQSCAFLQDELRRHAVVEIETADGNWVRNIYLPQGKALEGKIIRTKSQAGYQSTIHYSGRQTALSRGQSREFKHVNGQWFQAVDLENNGITYTSDAWSGVLPTDWIVPGIALQIRQGNLVGELTGLKVGAPTQLLIHTIEIGTCSAFVVGLLRYCRLKKLPHPFVVLLDSPLVAYREPDSTMEKVEDQQLRMAGVKEAFYRSLASDVANGQVIVFENEAPPENMGGTYNRVFSKSSAGRYSLFSKYKFHICRPVVLIRRCWSQKTARRIFLGGIARGITPVYDGFHPNKNSRQAAISYHCS